MATAVSSAMEFVVGELDRCRHPQRYWTLLRQYDSARLHEYCWVVVAHKVAECSNDSVDPKKGLD
jgi:hypothetical protein